MDFKTADKEYISKLKKTIIESSTSPLSWTLAYNQLYISDMNKYLRSLSSTKVIPGIGSFSPEYLIIIESMVNEYYKQIFLELIKSNISLDKIRISSIIKSDDIIMSKQINCFIKEIELLKPKNIIFLNISTGDYIESILKEKLSSKDFKPINIYNLKDLIEIISVAK